MHRLAVVLIIRKGQGLGKMESVSLASINEHLGMWPRYLVFPEGFPPTHTFDGWQRAPFRDSYFGSPIRYSRLLLSPEFYRAFSAFDYILVVHLDVLILDKVDRFLERS